jgi:hypothetical protein
MEIKFTASIIEALDCVLQLLRGDLWFDGKKVEPPKWCNFSFFNQIEASEIRRKREIQPAHDRRRDWWILKRTVKFFYHGSCIATVYLVGQKTIGHDSELDNVSFWGVTRLRYSHSFSGGLNASPEEWREIKFEHTSLRGHFVA